MIGAETEGKNVSNKLREGGISWEGGIIRNVPKYFALSFSASN